MKKLNKLYVHTYIVINKGNGGNGFSETWIIRINCVADNKVLEAEINGKIKR